MCTRLATLSRLTDELQLIVPCMQYIKQYNALQTVIRKAGEHVKLHATGSLLLCVKISRRSDLRKMC